MDITDKPQLNPTSTVDQQELLDSINAGHGIAISPASHVPAGFERLQRIYSEGDAPNVTGHMKIIRP